MLAYHCFFGKHHGWCIPCKKSISLGYAPTVVATPFKLIQQQWRDVDTTDDETCADHFTFHSVLSSDFNHAIPPRILNERKRWIEHLWRKDTVDYSMKGTKCTRNAVSTLSNLSRDLPNSGIAHTLRALLQKMETEPPRNSFKRRRSRKFFKEAISSSTLVNSNENSPSVPLIGVQEKDLKKELFTTRLKHSENSHVVEGLRHLPWIEKSYSAKATSSIMNTEIENIHVQLTKEIESLVVSLSPLPISLKLKDSIVSVITKEANFLFSANCHINLFGSVVNGFWTKNSDVDISLQLNGCSKRTDQVKALRRVAISLQAYPTSTLVARFNAKVPIIYWSPKFEVCCADCPIGCDISVNNSLAIVNSKLIATYVKLDSRLKMLGIAVKNWAKSRGINDRSKGTLSSFALILLLIHLLQHRPIPIFPSLQDIAISRHYTPLYLEGVDCRYCENLAEVEEELQRGRNGLPPNSENVGKLLLEFFRYYGFSYKCGVISIRDSTTLLHSIDPTAYYLYVDNPFEIGKDVANVTSEHYAHIRNEFRRAYTMLLHGFSFSHVCGAIPRQ
ncbi:polynucleotide adenylyltransferase [Cardiosporidium cionae]|uniref:Polynucleotide adenylyltransferase n=1 Tax=Cardiosporidium cionae TaxID=476202 RepID=A0ABQ7JDM6_9APIC|nr:polynucleotide adenylyltransferase [Cardiosporidium cionae]|eukprot:KAF8822064.1 polynucleotide adenylyltransferase [Cardiosporidium cionae]